MASADIKSLGVALEGSSYALIGGGSTTGVPDNSGATYSAMEFERASLNFDGQSHPMTERNNGRTGSYHMPPEPATMHVSGTRVRRRTGTLSVQFMWRGLGSASAFATYEAMPAFRILGSGMGVYTPGNTSDAVNAVSLTAANTRWTPTAIAKFPEDSIGMGVAVDVAGRREFSFVTDRVDAATDLVYASPGFTTDLTNASSHLVHLCTTLYMALGTTALGQSISVRMDGDGWQTYGYGGRLESATFTPTADGLLMVDAVIRFALFQDDHGSPSVQTTTYASGAVAHALGSYAIITGDIASAATPAEVAGVTYGVDSWSFTWTNTLARLGHSNDLAGASNLEVVRADVSASITLSTPSTTFDPYFLNQTAVSVLLGCGPTGSGNGIGLYIPAAHLTADAGVRQLGGDLVQQTLNFRQGLWANDDATAAPARTYARIALPLQT